MAFLNDATITTVREIADAIDTFLTANGFVQEVAPNGTTTGDASWSAATGSGELYVQMAWDSQTHFDLYQSTSDDGSAPGSNPGDSSHPSTVFFNNGSTDLSISNAELWGFTNGDVAADDSEIYAYFVLEYNRDGRYAHFGFGHLEKYSTWDGGAFKYGWDWSVTGSAEQEPWNAGHRVLMDGNHTGNAPASNLSTMTIRNMDGQPASGDWAVITNATSAPGTTDGNGNSVMKCEGYVRHGPWPTHMLHLRGNPNNAFVPIIPVEIAAHTGTGNTTTRYMLGKMPEIGVCNIGNIQPKEQITLGGVTWQFFPWGSKQTNAGTDVIASRNAGIAYRVRT